MKHFTANRLSGGNRLFPAEISVDNFGVTLKIPGLFSGREKTLSYDKISSVKIDTPMVGFSKITFDTLGWDYVIAEGFEKRDAEEIKQLVQLGIQSVRHGSNQGERFDMSHHIAQAEASKAQADAEKKRIELEEQKHRSEKEEKEAARRKERADELRKRGKHTLAFWVEMNPIYIGIGVIAIFFIVMIGYDKYQKHSQNEDTKALIEETLNKPNNNSQQQTTTTTNTEPTTPETNTQPPQKTNTQPQEAVTPPQEQATSSTATVVTDKAYFYTNADESTKRKGYLLKGQNVEIKNESGDFYNIIYTSESGKITEAWMLKSELQKN